MVGIEFMYLDGKRENYDPVDVENEFEETDFAYIFKVAFYTYCIKKNEIYSIRFYNLCQEHGYELIENKCKRCDHDD